MITKQEHKTSGTARRGSHQMSGRGVLFRLEGEVQSLRHDLEFTSGGRAARTLAKTAGLRVTLVVIKKDFGLTRRPRPAAPASRFSRAACASTLGESRGTSAPANRLCSGITCASRLRLSRRRHSY